MREKQARDILLKQLHGYKTENIEQIYRADGYLECIQKIVKLEKAIENGSQAEILNALAKWRNIK